jgi:hypothetical protein
LHKIADAFNRISEYVGNSNDKAISFSKTIKALNATMQASAKKYKSNFKISIGKKSIEKLDAVDKAFNSISNSLEKSNTNLYGFLSQFNDLMYAIRKPGPPQTHQIPQIPIYSENNKKQRSIEETYIKKNSKIIEGEFRELVTDIKTDTTRETANIVSDIVGVKNREKMQVVLNIAAKGKSLIDLGKVASKGKNISSLAKLGQGADGASAAGESAGTIGAGGIAIAAFAVAVMAFTSAAYYGQKRTRDFSSAVLKLGGSLNDAQKSSINTSNSIREGKNLLSNYVDELTMGAKGLFDEFAAGLGNFIDSLSNWDEYNKENPNKKNEEYKQYNVVDATSTTKELTARLRQSGFDESSIGNLIDLTRQIGLSQANKYGDADQEETIKKIADAWIDGSNAAAEYGAIVDDNTLAGYMASQGIDIVNTEITDALKQYYRFQLVQTELSNNDTFARQKQIQEWKKLGIMIDSTKQKLFSFDEVIQLSAENYAIPLVGSDGSLLNKDEVEGKLDSDKIKASLNGELSAESKENIKRDLANLAAKYNLSLDEALKDPRVLEELGNKYGTAIANAFCNDERIRRLLRKQEIKDTNFEARNQAYMDESAMQAASTTRQTKSTGYKVDKALVDKVAKESLSAQDYSKYVFEKNLKKYEETNGYTAGTRVNDWKDSDIGKAIINFKNSLLDGLSGNAIGSVKTINADSDPLSGLKEYVKTINADSDPLSGLNELKEYVKNIAANKYSNNTINFNVETLVAEDDRSIDKLTRTVADKLGILANDRGSLNYGSF